MTDTPKETGLALLREPFPENQVSKLPKGTKAQNTCPAAEKKNCAICGGWHHPKIIHLDYVGHAALTDRLLNADPSWDWEPLAFTDQGLPCFDASGGLWIKLTVCGMTRLGYGHAEGSEYKDIGSREKEVIGDALRNAAMRFGAALDLWHKGQLHADEAEQSPLIDDETKQEIIGLIKETGTDTATMFLKVFPDGNITAVDQLTVRTYGPVINGLKARKKQQAKDAAK